MIGGAVLVVAMSVAAFFWIKYPGEKGLDARPFNCSTFKTRPVDKLNGVVSDFMTYQGTGFRESSGDMWFFVSQWSVYAASASTGTVEWSFLARGSSPFVVDNGLLFFAGEFGERDGVHAVKIRNGELLWTFAAGGQIIDKDVVPIVTNDIVYFKSYSGVAFAVERETGKELWSYNTRGEFAGSPVPFGNLALLLLPRRVVAIGPAGEKQWEAESGVGQLCWARIVGDVACIRSSRGKLFGVRKDGTVVFEKKATTDPIVQDSVLYYGVADGSIQAYDLTALKTIWTSALGGRLASDPFLHAGKVFCATAKKTLLALAPDSGEQLWSCNIGSSGRGVALAAGDSYICAFANGERLCAVDIASGQERWAREFPTYRASPGHLDIIDQTVLIRTAKGVLRAVDASTGTDIWSAPYVEGRHVSAAHFVGGNLIYLSLGDGAFHCADIQLGTEKWRLQPPGVGIEYSPVLSESLDGAVCASPSGRALLVPFDLEGVLPQTWRTATPLSCSPAVDGDLIYFGHDDGVLECRKQPDKLWEFRANGSISAFPVVSEGCLYVGSEGGLLYKLNAEKGDLVWTFKTAGPIRVSPGVSEDTVYVGSSDEHVYAVSVAGKELWRSRLSGAVISSPASDGNALFVGDSSGKVFALDLASGDELWSSQIGAQISSSVGVYKNKVYFGCENGSFYALDAANGAEIWREQTGGSSVCAPSIAGGIVYFGSDDGFLHAADADSGDIKWRFKTGGPVVCPPAIRDGRLYLGSMDGFIYVIH